MALNNGRVKSQLQYELVQPPKKSRGRSSTSASMSVHGKKQPQYNALLRFYQEAQEQAQAARKGDRAYRHRARDLAPGVRRLRGRRGRHPAPASTATD